MNILVIGGTIFLGRHFVQAVLNAGHQLTLFHRGKSNPNLFPEAEHILGDRRLTEDLKKLEGRSWDALFDPSGYFPRDVETLLDVVGLNVNHYTFISSIGVYPHGKDGSNENSPVEELTSQMSRDKITPENYGPLKAAAEAKGEEMLSGKTLNIRPGLIAGPHDPSDRFTYWPWRVLRGGRVLAPGIPEQSVQVIDGRDLAGWILRLVETGTTGLFNGTGPAQPMPMNRFLGTCKESLGSDAEFLWASEEFLAEHKVSAYTEMPLWIPSESNGMNQADISRALEAGLTFRPIEETIRETMEWFKTTDRFEDGLRAGISRDRERELLGELSLKGESIEKE